MVKPSKFRPKLAEGIDLDSFNHLPLFKVFYNAQMIGKTGVRIKRSPSGEGYHIYSTENFTEDEAMMLGDCKGRVEYWEWQGYTFTFMNRHSRTGEIVGCEEDYDPLGEPFWRFPR